MVVWRSFQSDKADIVTTISHYEQTHHWTQKFAVKLSILESLYIIMTQCRTLAILDRSLSTNNQQTSSPPPHASFPPSSLRHIVMGHLSALAVSQQLLTATYFPPLCVPPHSAQQNNININVNRFDLVSLRADEENYSFTQAHSLSISHGLSWWLSIGSMLNGIADCISMECVQLCVGIGFLHCILILFRCVCPRPLSPPVCPHIGT